jgi:hypothetical protein
MRASKIDLISEVGGSIYPPNPEIGFASLVRVCVHTQRGTRCMRQSGLGCPASPPVDAAVGVDWVWPWVRPWVRPWARLWAWPWAWTRPQVRPWDPPTSLSRLRGAMPSWRKLNGHTPSQGDIDRGPHNLWCVLLHTAGGRARGHAVGTNTLVQHHLRKRHTSQHCTFFVIAAAEAANAAQIK